MERIFFFIVVFIIILLPDLYIYFSKVHLAFSGERSKRIGKWVYFGSLLLQYGGMLAALLYFYTQGQRTEWVNFFMGLFFGLFVIKLVFIVPWLLLGDAYKSGEWLVNKWSTQAEHLPERVAGRRRFLKQLSIILSSFPLVYFLHGLTVGKYHYQVNKISLKFKDLPPAFDGFKLAQISDFHAGSFDSLAGVQKGLKMLQSQGADLIVFTGDLVNEMANEVNPYLDAFQILDAPYGQYACLGNHDYGYQKAESRTAENLQAVQDKYAECKFQLLNNKNVKLEKDGEYIYLAGVENWSTSKYFPRKGDLDTALKGVSKDDFTILLSHDPTHFDAKVVPHAQKIHLTLSGHTHGTQLGVKLLGSRWSPAQYVYKKWAGLYKEAGQFLYINKGFGMLQGFAFRIGMFPEITLIELKREEE